MINKKAVGIRRNIVVLLISCLVCMLFTSCRVLYPSRMLRTGNDYNFSVMPEQTVISEYRLAPNDQISITFSTNEGEKLLDPSGISGQTGQQANASAYMVEFDGTINLPLIRRIKVEGMTLREVEKMLETQFAFYFNKPFVNVNVVNNRVIIFPGGQGGAAQVLKLENPNTTLFEALALAGGISDGKAYRIKLIRGDPSDRKVYLIDLSTIEGLKQADFILMANDIIYIEPVYRVPQTLVAQVTPYLTLFTTLLVIYSLFK